MRRPKLFFDIAAEDKSNRAFSSVDSALRRSEQRVAKMRGQFLAVAGAATAFGTALSAAAMRGAQEIDRAAKAARRMDASIGAFRGLELAASEAGVPLSVLANEVQNVNREIANIGVSGNADRALQRLGMSASDLAGLDADDKLAAIADQVQAMGLSAGEATAVLRDFGVRNREMALLLLGGGEAIRQATQDIEDYGLALTDVEAGRIEAANDQIARLGLVTQYAGQRLSLELVPAMGRFAEAITESLREGGLLRSVIDGLADNLDRIGIYVATATTAFGVRFAGALIAARLSTLTLAGSLAVLRGALIRTGIGALVVGAGEMVYQFTRLVEATGGWGKALDLLGEVASGVWEGIKTSATSIVPALNAVWSDVRSGFYSMLSEIAERWSRFLGDLGAGVEGAPGLGALADRLSSASADAFASVGRFDAEASSAASDADRRRAEAADRIASGFEKAREAASKLAKAVENTDDNTEGAADAADRLNEALNSLSTGDGGGGGSTGGGAVADLNQELDQLGSGLTEQEKKAQRLSDTLGSAFGRVVTGAQSARDAVSQLLQSFQQSLAERFFGSLFDGAINAFFGGPSGIPFFASGTDYAPGGLAVVGERGPELVNLPRGSRVHPAGETERMLSSGGGGGVVVNQTINVSTGVQQTVRSEIKSLMPAIAENAKSAVLDAKRRGGSYGGAF